MEIIKRIANMFLKFNCFQLLIPRTSDVLEKIN